jgi:hypothetical protein
LLPLLCLFPKAAPAAESLPLEDRPYRARVRIHFAATAEFDLEFRKSILAQTADGLECCVGSFWRGQIEEEQGTLFCSGAALKRLSSDPLQKHPELVETDKAYFLAVMPQGAALQVSGREWDATTRQLGPVVTRTSLDRRDLPSVLIALIHQLFRPLAEVELPRNGPASLHPQGGNLTPADSPWAAVTPGQLFETYQCQLDKELTIDRIQLVPWTYLVASPATDTGRIEASTISGLRSPISPRKHRMFTLALAINDRGGETRLTLFTRAKVRKPLAGVEVELAQSPSGNHPAPTGSAEGATERSPVPTLPRLITDRNGRVSLPARFATENKPIWLFVRSGPSLLARVPYVPGLRAVETIEVPDDSLRLEVEGDIALLQAKLVDAVARRAVLMAQARSRAKVNQFDAAAAALVELDAMPKAGKFLDDLNLIRINRTKTARERRDKGTEERIRKLVLETTELVTTYLDENKLTELKDETRELRRVAEENAAAEAKAAEAEARAAAQQNPPTSPATPGNSQPAK